MTDFSNLIPTARSFYAALADNNTRDWWQDNKATYDTQLKEPALALLDAISAPLAELTGTAISGKLFRPHRDVRFSKDKTPYNTHLHMMWQIESPAPQNPVFFFGIGVDYARTGAGLMGFDKPMLENWRKMLDLDTDRITGIISAVTSQGFTLRDPALKRVPAPYPQDHPAADLLRMKGLVAGRDLSPDGPLPEQIMQAFRATWPLNELLLSIAEA